MKSQTGDSYRYKSDEGDRGQRKHISSGQRRRNKSRKRRRTRKKRFLRIIRMGLCIGLLLTVFVYAGKMVWGERGRDIPASGNQVTAVLPSGNQKAEGSQTTPKYDLVKPKVLEGDEIRENLHSLAEKYPEFTEIYDNMEKYPEELMAALCNNPEMIDFVKGYLTAEPVVTGGMSSEELSEKFPLLIQWDLRWGYSFYGDNNIALSGCAPTCLSMVIVALTGNFDATPDAVADYSMENGYYQEGVGTKWSIMTEGCLHFGVQGEEIVLNKNTIFSELESGYPVICSMRPGDFTSTGHFIVLTGVYDGKVVVNDPNSRTRSSMLWDYETLEYQIKNLWVFHKK